MPGLPSKQARRKGPTPRRLIKKDDAWRVILAIMGLEPLGAEGELYPEDSTSSPATMDTEAAEAMAAPTAADSAAGAKKMTILDLPSETQKDIFKHVRFSRCRMVMHQVLGCSADLPSSCSPRLPTSLLSPLYRSTSEILPQSNCTAASISSSLMKMILRTTLPSMVWQADWTLSSRANTTMPNTCGRSFWRR